MPFRKSFMMRVPSIASGCSVRQTELASQRVALPRWRSILRGFIHPGGSAKSSTKPVRAWAAGVTNESVRDVLQDKLVGPPTRRAEWGHGMIPKHCIDEVSMARGTADLIDTLSVLHESGGYSQLQFKSYSEGREKWQGVGPEVVYLDEEPPEPLYFEALTRTNETGGIVYTVFTPLLGMSNVVRMFLHEGIKI
jgi:phage terminase large subunit-like protein